MGTKVYDNYEDLITFNRNSKGTALRPIGYGDELVTNGDFSDGSTGWTLGTGWSVSGGAATHVGGTPQYLKWETGIEVGKIYQMTVEVTAVNGGSASLYIGNSPSLLQATSPGTYTVIGVASSKNLGFAVRGNSTNPAHTVTVDNISVKEVLFDREGDPLTLFLHPEGVPRIEYDADRNLKGLLIEPDGENAMFPSIPDTTWNNTSSVTITTDDAVAPDGTTTATKVEGIGSWIYRNTVIGTDTGTWTFSCWVKAVTVGTNNTFRLTVGGNNLSGNLTATGEWQRFEFTYTDGGGSSNGLLRDSSSNDADLYVWGAQLETGTIATSYMPTTGSPFTRDADDASMTNVSGLIGQKEGTIYVEADWRLRTGRRQYLLRLQSSTVGGDHAYFRLSDASDVIRFQLEQNGVAKVVDTTQSSDRAGIQKIAFAYASGNCKFAINGTAYTPSLNNAFAFTSALDTIFFHSSTQSQQPNMWIRAAQIIPRRLSDEQLIELTS